MLIRCSSLKLLMTQTKSKKNSELSETAKTLIDAEMNHPVVQEIKDVMAQFPQVEMTDLHVWKVGKGKFSCILGLETTLADLSPDQVKAQLSIHEEIVHASVEIHHI